MGRIPARAGQPILVLLGAGGFGAYPRSRGATREHRQPDALVRGLSPLARGTHHPRSRFIAHQGLSPLARGNRSWTPTPARSRGPIPARAGQPCRQHSTARAIRAYPRSRGATFPVIGVRGSNGGLSPLARGNRDGSAAAHGWHGPIPARAGQPRPRRPWWRARPAYPRSRGATSPRRGAHGAERGLSPLARGNRGCAVGGGRANGPIPARAGQPGLVSSATHKIGAYPRFARGNPWSTSRRRPNGGPIPARAGQPLSGSLHPFGKWAYPRSRGAT